MLLTLVVVLFVIYCTSESLANIARHAGARSKLYPLGLMLSNQVYSVNRLNGFLIAPLLGLYVDRGGGEGDLKAAAIIGCLASAILLLVLMRGWRHLLGLFSAILDSLRDHGFSVSSLRSFFLQPSRAETGFENKHYDLALISAQALCTSLAMPTAFFLNILAIRHPEYQATLVQSATVISGVGNLVLNFYISPRIAIAETNGQFDAEYFSVMVGKIVGIGLLASCVLTII